MKNNGILTAEYLRSILHYDAISGVFVWISPPKEHPRMMGQIAGSTKTGYVMIKIDGQRYKGHRLAWLYVTGVDASFRIDHRDGNGLNNSFDNLRLATQAQNCANSRLREGKSLPKGVRKNGNKFTARIRVNRKLITLGTFADPGDAASAYLSAAKNFYGEFARAR